ncbi:MAG: T9SS type A sorting domain-containing protein [Saprospiraceae bacterium]
MKTFITTILFLFTSLIGTAQANIIQNIGSGGEHFATNNTILDVTIGGMTGDLNSDNYQLGIGFQQPEYSNPIVLSTEPTTSFFIEVQQNNVKLRWRTNTYENGYFTVEYSNDKIDWQQIGRIAQRNSQIDYEFSYSQLDFNAHYRIILRNNDDTNLWTSTVRTVNLEKAIRIYPNPVQSSLNIQVSQDLHMIKIIDSNGKNVLSLTLSEQQNIDVTGYAKGNYFVIIKNLANRNRAIYPLIIQ